jgi:hypothetical protein
MKKDVFNDSYLAHILTDKHGMQGNVAVEGGPKPSVSPATNGLVSRAAGVAGLAAKFSSN